MSIVTKLRCITLDVTGTLIAYKGELGEYYCMAGCKIAYTNTAKEHPSFGFAEKIPNIVCFKRIYSTFGSVSPYTMFSDSKPFLRWAKDDVEGVYKENPQAFF
ncbi:hypothetical protein DCAR_0101361 [Daucus carota subsp. sativus]|uniref:Uncharacterized protein n=1 Tax=Daucus carota subsp. sativus TaxID=79200 RepID=A0AAF1AFD1_DAUCS|nr:hypothetical protein DCAR_0101361 [Daucus carota subsp. sativus]